VTGIRAVTVTMSRLLGDLILMLVADRVRVSLVARLGTRLDIERRLSALAPDLIFIGLRNGEVDDIAAEILRLVPEARVVALSSDGRDAFVHDRCIGRTAFLNATTRALVDTLLSPGLTRRP
jgi:hypothetical protein